MQKDLSADASREDYLHTIMTCDVSELSYEELEHSAELIRAEINQLMNRPAENQNTRIHDFVYPKTQKVAA